MRCTVVACEHCNLGIDHRHITNAINPIRFLMVDVVVNDVMALSENFTSPDLSTYLFKDEVIIALLTKSS